MKHIALISFFLIGCTSIEGEWYITSYRIESCPDDASHGNADCHSIEFPGAFLGCTVLAAGNASFRDGKASIDVNLAVVCQGRPKFSYRWMMYYGEYRADDGMLIVSIPRQMEVKFWLRLIGQDSAVLASVERALGRAVTTELKLERCKGN